MLIGLCGAAGSGKTTIAEGLRDRHGFRVLSFADPLYDAVAAITGVPVERLKDRAVKEVELPGIGRSPRYLLQTLGTDWGRAMVDENLWINAAMARVAVGEDVVIADVRFDNEAQAIRDRGGRVFYVVRPGWRCLKSTEATHSSERGVCVEKIDGYITNDGTIDQLLDDFAGRIIEG